MRDVRRTAVLTWGVSCPFRQVRIYRRPGRCRMSKTRKPVSLAALVRHYQQNAAQHLEKELEYYRSLKPIKDVIWRGTMGIDKHDKMHSHQHRLGYGLLEMQAEALLDLRKEISQASTFDELHELIWENRIPGVGPLACYDAGVRIVAYLKLEPTVIYLHMGTREGYRAIVPGSTGRTATVESLPPALRVLSASHLENFLCIYKSALRSGQLPHSDGCKDGSPRPRPGC
jgi:hypothetical protein